MVVRLDNPKTVKFAESSTAPTFGEIADWMANYYGLRQRKPRIKNLETRIKNIDLAGSS